MNNLIQISLSAPNSPVFADSSAVSVSGVLLIFSYSFHLPQFEVLTRSLTHEGRSFSLCLKSCMIIVSQLTYTARILEGG